MKNQDLDLIKEAKPLPKEDKKKGAPSKATKSLMSNWLKKSPSTTKTTDANESSNPGGVKREADDSNPGPSQTDDSNPGPSQVDAAKDGLQEKKIKLDKEDISVKDENLLNQYKADTEEADNDVSFKDEDLIWDYIVYSDEEKDDEAND